MRYPILTPRVDEPLNLQPWILATKTWMIALPCSENLCSNLEQFSRGHQVWETDGQTDRLDGQWQ